MYKLLCRKNLIQKAMLLPN